MKRLLLVALVALVAFSMTALAGPVVLTGDDLEDHIGFTGAFYQSLFANQYALSSNAGAGILVLGGAASLGTVFGGGPLDLRTLIPGGPGAAPTTVVGGAAAIAAAAFDASLYKMIYVPSDAFDTFGGVTAAENAALAGRSGAIATWVNTGGGLWANTQGVITGSPWTFVGGLGGIATIDCGPGGCADAITETAAGLAAGLPLDGDHCCFHTAFVNGTYEPVGLSALAFYDAGQGSFSGHAAIIGGGATTTITPAIPEPGTLLLLGSGLVGVATRIRKTKKG